MNLKLDLTFSEVIKVRDGVFYNLPLHAARMAHTSHHFFGRPAALELTTDMIPPHLRHGLVKCRVVYAEDIVNVEFTPYVFREIRSVGVVCDNEIEYAFKSTDRSRLNDLLAASGCDEIIIVKNGFVTDSSTANLLFEDSSGLFTPSNCLLRGTKRALLLQRGMISERVVKIRDLRDIRNVYLINAMIDPEDSVVLPMCDLDL